MSLNPFAQSFLQFPGFSPVVEADSTGRIVHRLPQQSLTLPGELTRRGILSLGLPGSGKTTRLLERGVVAALRQPEASVVVFAVQPGSARQAWAAHDHLRPSSTVRPALFNPGDADACTHFMNPIAKVRSRAEAMVIGQTLCQPPPGAPHHSDSDYFLLQAATMIGHAIRAVNAVHHGQGTLGHVRDAIDDGPIGLKSLADNGDIPALSRFATEILEGNRNSETSLAQMSNCLQWVFDDDARLSTSRQELHFDRVLLQQPGLLVIAVNEEEIPRQRALISLIFRNLFAWIIRRGRRDRGPLPRPLYIFIDELPAAGRIPELGIRLTATCRKSDVSVFCAAQCEAQLVDVYGTETAAVLAGFGSRIFVPPVEFSDAERASHRKGTIEVATHVTDSDGRLLHSTPQARPLLLPSEIASPPRDAEFGPRILFELADMPPFFGHLRASWELAEEDVINERAAELELPRRRRRRSAARPTRNPGPRKSVKPEASPEAAYRGWSRERMSLRYRELMDTLDFPTAIPSAQEFWRSLERTHQDRPSHLLWCADQLAARHETIDSFFQASVFSGTENPMALIHYLDFQRLKQQVHKPSAPERNPASQELSANQRRQDAPCTEDDEHEFDEEDFLAFLASENEDDEGEDDDEGAGEDDEDEVHEDDEDSDDRMPF